MATQPARTPVHADNRHILFHYRNRKGTEIVIGASLAWLLAVIVIALVRPEVLSIPAALGALWKSWRGG